MTQRIIDNTVELIGRDDELEVVRRLIDESGAVGRALVIEGYPGVGKSSLLAQAASNARSQGLTVLDVFGVENESLMPFSGLLEMLSPVLDQASALPPQQRSALLTALGVHDGAPPEVFLVALAALNLIAEVASGSRVLLAVDDVQWLDHQTGTVLAFIGRRLAKDAIIMIATFRTGGNGPFSEGQFDTLQLEPLDDEASSLLLSRTAENLSSAERSMILREAQGNPLALTELPRGVSQPTNHDTGQMALTARLEHAFASRFGQLPDATRSALLVAALSEESAVAEVVAAVGRLCEATVGIGIFDPAAEARLLYISDERVVFRHPLVRSAVLQTVSLQRLHLANRALADVLIDQPYRRAWHLAQATVGTNDEIADQLEASHLEPLRRGSPLAAIRRLERAAQLTSDSGQRGRRLLLAAELGFAAGRADIVQRLVDAAAQADLSTLDRVRKEWLSEIFNDGVPGDAARVGELCEIAVRAAQADETTLAINLILGAALRCWWADPGDQARKLVVATINTVGLDRDDPRRIAIIATADPIDSAQEVSQALTRHTLEAINDADVLRLLGQAAHAIGDGPRSIDFLGRAESRLRRDGRLGSLTQVITMQVLDYIIVGDWEAAYAAIEEARLLARETGQSIWDIGSKSLAAITAAIRGDADTAEQLAAEVEFSTQGRSLNDLLACIQLARGFAAAGKGRYSSAYDALRRLFDPDDVAYAPTERFHGIVTLAESASRCGQQVDARRVVARLHDDARITDAPNLTTSLMFADAVLADDNEAEQLFLAAIEADLSRWPLLRARTKLAYAMWLRRQRRSSDAREHLHDALRAFQHIGADHWADLARAELRATGEAIAQETAPAGQLSAQEHQIARLAAKGLSNREIAEQLYLSPRTVGSHLYRIFPKLGISSRNQLAARIDGIDKTP